MKSVNILIKLQVVKVIVKNVFGFKKKIVDMVTDQMCCHRNDIKSCKWTFSYKISAFVIF